MGFEGTIKKMRQVLRRDGGCFAFWSGVVFDMSVGFIRADHTYLNIIRLEDDEPWLIRTVGWKQVQAQSPIFRFSLRPVIRITSGDRRGWVVPESSVEGDESFKAVRLRKRLQVGNDREDLQSQRKEDRAIIKIIKNYREYTIADGVVGTVPIFYLVFNEGYPQLTLRNTAQAVAYLQTSAEYDPDLSIEANAKVVLPGMAVNAGECKGKVKLALPYEHVYGRGVVSASVERFGLFWWMPSMKCSGAGLSHIEVDE